MSPAPQPEFTVIVATRNRSAVLAECLRHLAAQQTDGAFTYEVLVVDNGSTDETRVVVERLASSYPVALRYAYEGRPGKPWALNLGLSRARGAVFAFTDDDIVVSPAWLRAFRRCFLEEHPDVVTGRIAPLWKTERPAWLSEDSLRFGESGCLDYGERRLRRSDRSNLRWVGGNFAIRREVAQRVGGFDVRMIRAQDTEYYWRGIRQGMTVVYEPDALASHTLGADRMTPDYFRRWRHRTGYHHAYFVPWRKYHLLTIMPVGWYGKTFTTILRWWRAWLARRPWGERFRFELSVREAWSVWLHRLQLWPRWWLTVVTGRSWLPQGQTQVPVGDAQDEGAPGASPVDVSVVIPTYNRAASVREALAALAAQRTEGRFTYEVLVVDNASTDATPQVVRELAAGYPVALRYLREPRQGKPFASNTGLRASRGRFVVCTDDDAVGEPAWLAALWRCFEETGADAVAGKVVPRWIGIEPGWETEQIERHIGTIGCLDFGPQRLQVSPSGERYWWVGSNIAVRRTALERYGVYDVRVLRADDADLFNRYCRQGARIIYEPSAVVRHAVPKDRLTPEVFRSIARRAGRDRAYAVPWKTYHLLTVMPASWYPGTARLALRWVLTGRGAERAWERLGYECKLRAHLAHFSSRLRLWPRWWLAVLSGQRTDRPQ